VGFRHPEIPVGRKTSSDHGEVEDLVRRTLAANFSSRKRSLPPACCPFTPLMCRIGTRSRRIWRNPQSSKSSARWLRGHRVRRRSFLRAERTYR
jgi:hypothetical protein